MTEQVRNDIAGGRDLELREMFATLWSNKIFIVVFSLAFAILSIVLALTLPAAYKSEVLLAPVGNTDQGQEGLLSQYGGLASLAGIDLGSSGVSKVDFGLEVLQSRRFVTEFIEQHDLLPFLFAADYWDQDTNSVVFDNDIYSPDTKEWLRSADSAADPKPSAQEGFEAFSEMLSVDEDEETGFIHVSIEYLSPTLAKEWVERLIEELNNTMRKRDVEQAQQSVEYLNEQLQTTSLKGIETVLYRLIEEQMKTIMLARTYDEYLFETVDPAVVPEKRSKPPRTLIFVVGTVGGLLLSCMFVLLLRHFGYGPSLKPFPFQRIAG